MASVGSAWTGLPSLPTALAGALLPSHLPDEGAEGQALRSFPRSFIRWVPRFSDSLPWSHWVLHPVLAQQQGRRKAAAAYLCQARFPTRGLISLSDLRRDMFEPHPLLAADSLCPTSSWARMGPQQKLPWLEMGGRTAEDNRLVAERAQCFFFWTRGPRQARCAILVRGPAGFSAGPTPDGLRSRHVGLDTATALSLSLLICAMGLMRAPSAVDFMKIRDGACQARHTGPSRVRGMGRRRKNGGQAFSRR